jgi:hypothetical protein
MQVFIWCELSIIHYSEAVLYVQVRALYVLVSAVRSTGKQMGFSANTAKPPRQIFGPVIESFIESSVKVQWKFHRNRPPKWVIQGCSSFLNAQRSNAQGSQSDASYKSKSKQVHEIRRAHLWGIYLLSLVVRYIPACCWHVPCLFPASR